MARILVVEDDVHVLDRVRRMLERAGHEVMEAHDGKTALNLYRQQPTDVVLLDVYLPGSDGIETTLRLIQEFPDARIVAMSGGGFVNSQTTLELAEKVGVLRTLSKPFSLDELLTTVREVLSRGVSETSDRADPGLRQEIDD